MANYMRALYYISLGEPKEENEYLAVKAANENRLNQNFTVMAQKLLELEERLAALENGAQGTEA